MIFCIDAYFYENKIIDAYYAKNLDAYLSENKSEPRGDPFKLRNLFKFRE